MSSTTIGLDIGSTAVRAAEIEIGKDGRRYLRRYGQVGLAEGQVVDGEVVSVPGVAAALKRLWAEVGFSSTKVVVGVSGPRVFVRQADVPAMGEEDMKSSLKFDAQDMIPIPMEDASVDFSILGPAQPGEDGKATQRILLVAAHRELLRSYIAALKEAGLTAQAMDPAPLALMRAVPSATVDGVTSGTDVLVSIGAELTIVAVREAGVPRFIRTLSIGGAKLTESIANTLHLELALAESLKRGQSGSEREDYGQVQRAMSPELRELADEVRATIDFFLSQTGGSEIDRLVVTGGASQVEGLARAVAGTLPVEVMTLDPLATLDCSTLPLDPGHFDRIRATSANAVGSGLWTAGDSLIRLSVLPDEVIAAQRARRLLSLAGTGLVGLAVVLGLVAGAEIYRVKMAEDKVHHAQREVAALQVKVAHLQKLTAIHGEAVARAGIVASALQGDVDWVRVLGQLASVMPPEVSLTSFTGTRTIGAATTSAAAPAAGQGTQVPTIGNLSFSVSGTGGLPAAAAWIDGLATDPDLANVAISSISVRQNGGTVSFSSSANLTHTAESHRSKEVQP